MGFFIKSVPLILIPLNLKALTMDSASRASAGIYLKVMVKVNIIDGGNFNFCRDWASFCGGVVKANKNPAVINIKKRAKKGLKYSTEYAISPVIMVVITIASTQKIKKNIMNLKTLFRILEIAINKNNPAPRAINKYMFSIKAHRMVIDTRNNNLVRGSSLWIIDTW
jgi:hypothetical protein